MKLNKRIITIMASVCSLFLIMVVYLTYFTLFKADEIQISTYNPRIWEKEERILRGKIYDRNGTVLAESEQTENGQRRIYPYGSLYTHTIGYNSRSYGKSNIELKYNDYLLKTESVFDVLKRKSTDEQEFYKGADMQITLDHGMTKLAKEQLADANGSVVVLNPVTGAVYCMYSNPSFDPNSSSLAKNWSEINKRDDSPFLARATRGLYAPGSTFKTVTAAAGIENGLGDFSVEDKGQVVIGGYKVKNAGTRAYGTTDMKRAISVSSNVFFATLATEVKNDALKKMADAFKLHEKIPFDIDTDAVELDYSDMDKAELAATGIGQGKLQVTPLHMALVASAIANRGIMMKPYMVEKIGFENGKKEYSAKAEVLSRVMESGTARSINEYMQECVQAGTGTRARVNGISVAGKTGTAENEKEGKTHAWFICFAPADNPQVAMCVMKEYSGGGGGDSCAPIAAKLIQYSVNNGIIQ